MYATGELSVEIFICENLISIKVVEILKCSQVRKTERIMEKKEGIYVKILCDLE